MPPNRNRIFLTRQVVWWSIMEWLKQTKYFAGLDDDESFGEIDFPDFVQKIL